MHHSDDSFHGTYRFARLSFAHAQRVLQDEADILGDRIAIMAEGQLRCAGSSLFLKKTYGVGYQLTIEKGKHVQAAQNGKRLEYTDDDEEEEIDLEETERAVADDAELREMIKSAIPEASLLSDVGTELRFQIPLAAASEFPSLFDKLDQESESGGVVSYGVSMTTLGRSLVDDCLGLLV